MGVLNNIVEEGAIYMRIFRSFIFLILLLLVGCDGATNNQSGEIYLIDARVPKTGNAIISMNPSGDDINAIMKNNIFYSIECSQDKTKLLLGGPNYSIYEYDLKQKKLNTIIVNKFTKTVEGYYYVRYIPHSNKISYMSSDGLYVYDMDKKERTRIVDASDNYTWSMDGKFLLFCNDIPRKIYKFNINTKEIQPLFNGESPEYSNNNEFLAYTLVHAGKDKKDILVIKDMKSGKEWRREEYSIVAYRFSPDDKYIVFNGNKKGSLTPGMEYIKKWDFKKGRTWTLIKDYYSSTPISWR